MGEWLSLRGLAQVNKTDLKGSVIMVLLISHLWIHPQIARLTKFESECHLQRIVVYSHRMLQDVNNETLKVINTCSQVEVVQQIWKTSMSGWWQKAQLVWIWTEHKSSRILTSWWHHQWANFFGRFEGYFSTSSSPSSCWSSSSPWSNFRDHWPIWRSLRSSLYYKLNLVGVVYIILFHHNYHIRIVAILIIMITNYDI